MPTRLPSSMTRSTIVSSGVLPRSLATSASVLPVIGLSLSFLNATSRTFSAEPAAWYRLSQSPPGPAISRTTRARVAGSFSRAIQASRPPAWTQVGIAASSPVAPAVYG